MVRKDAICSILGAAAARAQAPAKSAFGKQAGPLNFLTALPGRLGAARNLFDRGIRAAGNVVTSPVAFGTAAGLGATYTASGHAYNRFLGFLGRDPIQTAANAGDHQTLADQYRQHAQAADAGIQPLVSAHQQALTAGDFDRANMLAQRIQTRRFDTSDLPQANWWQRLTGSESPEQRANRELTQSLQGSLQRGGHTFSSFFNPWQNRPELSTAQHRQQAMAAQTAMTGAYDRAMRQHMQAPDELRQQIAVLQQSLQSPATMPAQRQALQSHLANLQAQLANPRTGESTRAADIMRLMRESGMPPHEYRGPQAFGSGAPSGFVPPGMPWQTYAAQLPQQPQGGQTAFAPPPPPRPQTSVQGWSY
jgi:hypothetical protein